MRQDSFPEVNIAVDNEMETNVTDSIEREHPMDEHVKNKKIAKRFFDEGQYKHAAYAYTAILEDCSQDDECMLMLGRSRINLGLLDEAFDALLPILAHDNLVCQAFALMAEIRRQQGDLPTALALSHVAIEMNSAVPYSFIVRAYIYDDMGHKEMALNNLDYAYHHSGKGFSRYDFRCRLLLETGRVEEAEAMLCDAKEKGINDHVVDMDLGLVHFYRGEERQALEHFLLAAEDATLKPEALLFSAWCLQNLNRHSEALEHVEQSLKLAPERSEAVVLKAEITDYLNCQIQKQEVLCA